MNDMYLNRLKDGAKEFLQADDIIRVAPDMDEDFLWFRIMRKGEVVRWFGKEPELSYQPTKRNRGLSNVRAEVLRPIVESVAQAVGLKCGHGEDMTQGKGAHEMPYVEFQIIS